MLIRAAGEEFAHGGFDPVSLNRISKRAGVSYGGLHHHFTDKRDLARAVVSEATAVLLGEVCAAPDPGLGGDRPTALRRLIEATYRFVALLDRDPVFKAGFVLTLDGSVPDLGESLREQWQHWVEEALVDAERARELGEGIHGADVATAVVAATVGFEVLAVRDRTWLKPDVVARFWRLILPRVASPATAASLDADGGPPLGFEPAG